MSYKIKLEIFEGPLDLLLYLVKKNHLNIYDIPIAKVTEQYINYIELMRLLDLNIAGEFLVMAATLLHIKSKMLLPAEPSVEQEEEDDPRAELVKLLVEYERFKEIAAELKERESSQKQLFKRPKIELPKPGDTQQQEVYFEASLFDLITAFSQALKDVPRELFYEVVKDEFTIEDKTHQILHLLLEEPSVNLNYLFSKAKTKLEIVTTFLAILELIRQKEIIVMQKMMFDEIQITRNKDNIIPICKKTE
jgi:segregation and condensation protein A